MPFHTILPSLLARAALWFGSGQRGFEPKEAATQEAAQFLCDDCIALLWLGLRLVTCARDAGEMVFFTPS